MTPVTTFAGKTVAVFGLGASGNATVRALMAGGARVAAWDDGAAGRASAEAAGVPLVDLSAADWSQFAALVLAPGVPLTHPEPHWVVLKAREESAKRAGKEPVEVIGDIELFCRERNKIAPEAPFIAITGTNGKSTTTALIAHILREAGRDVQMGGNIGVPILALEPPAMGRYHVIEMSSFQIDLTPSVNPTVGVLLNITPDHIDRHGTVEHYASVKERLVANSIEAAIIGVDDEWSRGIATRLGTLATLVSTKNPSLELGMIAIGNQLVWRSNGEDLAELDLSYIASLRGEHNAQNAAAAAAVVAGQFALDLHQVQRYLRTYPGLPHRMEEIGRVGEVLFINDSKATNADSTEKALLSFAQNVFWILGGKPKEGGIESLRPYFPGVTKAYLIGAATDAFAATLEGQVPFERCGTLDVAVAMAAGDAAPIPSPRSSRGEGQGEGRPQVRPEPAAAPHPDPLPTQALGERGRVVLLSPACASYDQFANFEKRGDAFRALVRALPGFIPRALK